MNTYSTPLLIAALCLSLAGSGNAQPGFSKWFDFGTEAIFHNILVDQDTLVIPGVVWNSENQQLEAMLVKMDTFGQVISYETYADSLGSHLSLHQGYPIIRAHREGYLTVGDVINRESDFIIKWKQDGTVAAFWEYPYQDNVRTSLIQDIKALPDGYLVFSTRQMENYLNDIYVTKISLTGEVEWEQAYGLPGRGESVGSVWVENNNTIVIGGKRSTDLYVNPPSQLKCQVNWIFAIDSLGEVAWEWLSEPCAGSIVEGLHRTPDGGWIYATRHAAAFNQWSYGTTPKVVRRDSSFNLLWERQLIDSFWDLTDVHGLEPTPDGGWAIAARCAVPEPYSPLSPELEDYMAGCLFKINGQGDTLWRRCDTVSLGEIAGAHNYGGLAVLPSGSVVAAGGFKEPIVGVGNKSWAWAVKVGPNGCMEPECLLTSAPEVQAGGAWRAFPNPGWERIYFERPPALTATSATIRITDATGRAVWKYAMPAGEPQASWNASRHPPGLYFYQVATKDGTGWNGKLMVE